ncbi:hypothetical protein [Aeromonas jandaei]|uniref:hypothetical protein n=1 Tax=Aeromonas jandaei TaxID=650 RepID=UPI0009DFCF1E|nr:hypothetical protein [Aeromonas jandaei]
MKRFFSNLAKRILNPLFKTIRKKQDNLKRRTNRRYEGLLLGSSSITCNESHLQVGDVILCSSSVNSKNSYLISEASDGVYVHCAIYVGDGMIVDMVVPQIRKISLHELSQDYRYLTVVRCFGINKVRQDKIIEFANLCLDKKVSYNYLGAVISPIKEYRNHLYHYVNQVDDSYAPKYETKKTTSLFCSEFIIECYKHANYIQKNSSRFQSDKWTPTGISEDNNIFEFIGYLDYYLDSSVLNFVHPSDPYLAGNEWVLKDEGQKRLAQRKIEFEKRVQILKHELDPERK